MIGGGMAGLAAAILLARKGRDVALFEANAKLGGCCATTTIDGHAFNDGAVFLAAVGILDHAFARLGLERAELLPLRRIRASFSARLPDGSTVTLGENQELTVTGRAVDAGCLKREMRSLVAKWQPVLRFVTEELVTQPFSSWRLLRKGWRHLHKLRGSVASEISHLFSDQAVRSALSGALLYGGMPAREMPASAMVGLVAQIAEGLYLPEGGMGRIPQVLGEALQACGARVRVGSRVERIIVEGGRVRAVEAAGQGRIDAGAVISTASAMLTFGALVDPEHRPAAIARRLAHPRLSHRAVSVQLGLANRIEAPAHSMNVLPWMEDQGDVFLENLDEIRFPTYVVPTVTLPELAPRGGSIIEMFCPARSDRPVANWDAERKKRVTEAAVAALRQVHDLDIRVTRVRTPRDFHEEMHLVDGALYGLSPAATPRELFPHASGIPGLFLAGQTTFPGYGVGAAMMSGIFAAEALRP